MGRASSATRKPHGSSGGTEPPSRGVVQASAKRLRPGCGPEGCRQAQAAVAGNSSNKIHQTWPKPSGREFHQERRGQSRGREGFPFADWVKKLGAPPRSAPPPYVRPRPPTTESGQRQQVAVHAAGGGGGGGGERESGRGRCKRRRWEGLLPKELGVSLRVCTTFGRGNVENAFSFVRG